MCQKGKDTTIEYDPCLQEHIHDVPGPLRWLSPPVQYLQGYDDP